MKSEEEKGRKKIVGMEEGERNEMEKGQELPKQPLSD